MRNLAILILCSLASLAQAQTSSGYSVPNSGTGLTVFIGSGTTTTTTASIVTWPGALVNVTANAATYIYVDSTGHVSTSTNTTGLTQPSVCDSGFASQSFPIAKVTANFFQVQTVVDCRTTFNLAGAGTGAITSVFGRTGVITANAGDYTWDKIGAGSNLLSQTMGSDGSLSPLNIGQVAGSQMWLAAGLSAPTFSCSNTGGSIIAGQNIQLAYTLNTGAGATLGSVQVTSGVLTGCTGSAISITVNAPTLPSGYTGWTAYYCNGSGSPSCTAPVQVASCINITGNCVITSPANGTTALPTINTAWLQPPNVQAFNGTPGEIPSIFFPKADGNYYPWASVEWASCDATGGPPLPCGTPVITHRTYFSDIPGNNVQYNSPIAYKNSAISLSHRYGVGTTLTNQDRGIAIFTENSPANDTSTYRGLFGIQQELDINGAPVVTGGTDANVFGGQFQISTVMTATPGTLPANVAVINSSWFNAGTGYLLGGGNVAVGVNSSMTNNASTSAPAGTLWSPFRAQWGIGTGVGTNLFGQGYECDLPITAKKFSGGNYCFYIPNEALTLGNIDLALNNEWQTSPGLTWNLIGPTVLDSISHDQVGTMGVNASTNVLGSLSTSQITSGTSGIASVNCSGGASVYTYQLVFVDANGGQFAAPQQNSSAACTNPLTSGNPATINLLPGLQRNDSNSTSHIYQQASRIDLYRVGGPMATGKIGSLSCKFNMSIYGCTAFSDTGLSASGSVPTVNSTGSEAPQFVSNTNGGAANKIAGTCTAGAATTCTVTFTNPFVSAPVCTATDASNITTLKVTPSATALVITTTGATSDVFDYICVGNPT